MKILTSSDGMILILSPNHNLGISAKINSHLDIATQPLESKEINLKMLSGPPRMAKHDSRGFVLFCFVFAFAVTMGLLYLLPLG